MKNSPQTMIVVSDTSTLSALIQIDRLDILEKVFNHIVIPEEVYKELQRLKQYKNFIEDLQTQNWLKIQSPSSVLTFLPKELDSGEIHAMSLYLELDAELLIIDENLGRKVARSLDIKITGLGGVFIRAKHLGVIAQVQPMLKLVKEKAGFFLSEKATKIILKAAGEAQ